MTDIAVVTDSTADIPADLAAELEITVIPCHVHFGTAEFRDGVDLSRQKFFELLRQETDFPRTASPPIGVFQEAYRQAAQRAEHIIAIHVASGFSTLYNVARLAAQSLPDLDIRLFDSRQISICIGWLAIMAARAAKAGASLEEIVHLVEDAIPRLRLLGYVPNLAYLKQSGRVGWISAMIGNMLKISPIILIQDGEARLVSKVRSRSKGIVKIGDLVAGYGSVDKIAALHIDAPENAKSLAQVIRPYFQELDIPVMEAGVILGTHAGPGAIGIASLLQSKEQTQVLTETRTR